MQLCGEALCQIDTVPIEVGSSTTAHLKPILKSLGTQFPPITVLSKKNCVMRHRMRKSHKLKVIHYAARMIKLKGYLADFPEENSSDKIGETELNEIILNIIPNGCIKQVYVQGFDYGYITLKIC